MKSLKMRMARTFIRPNIMPCEIESGTARPPIERVVMMDRYALVVGKFRSDDADYALVYFDHIDCGYLRIRKQATHHASEAQSRDQHAATRGHPDREVLPEFSRGIFHYDLTPAFQMDR